jgi:predicted DNA-binding transcriptional regulator YafY
MPEVKQIERVIRILQRFYVCRELTVSDLYEYFDRQVPKRTLLRDLNEISAANIPIRDEPHRGRERVWRVDKNFLRFIPQTIGNQEVLASFFLERLAVVAKGTRLEQDIRSLLDKAKQLIGPNVFESTDGGDLPHDMFGATFMGYIDYTDHSDKIDALVKATSECRTCRFVYKRGTGEKESEFTAEPYLLLYHKGAMYAVVYVSAYDNYIFLPVQRIRSIAYTGERFERDPQFSLEKLREGRFGIFGGPDLKPERVVLKFGADIADVVAERMWHPSQVLTRNKDGSLTMELETVISDELRAWVGSWLHRVEVIEGL